MVIWISGLLNSSGGNDLSVALDRRAGMDISSAIGSRLDTLHFTLHDPTATLVIPERAEIIVYDATVSATWLKGQAPIVDAPTTPPFGSPSLWTPRLFGGFVSHASYSLDGAERYIEVDAQDYTIRNRTTVVNKAYGPGDVGHPTGWTDDQMVKDLFAIYRPDVDTSNVTSAFTTPGTVMPAISYPTHTLEQFFQRVLKITQGWFRVDYYKRLFYGGVGSGSGSYAPFALSDTPNSAVPANLLPSGDFEQSTESWSIANDLGYPPVQSTAQAASGTHCLQLTGNATSSQYAIAVVSTRYVTSVPTTQVIPGGVGTVAVIPGSTYSGQVKVRSAATPRSFALALVFTDATGTQLSTAGGTAAVSTTTGWTLLTCTGAAPTGAAWTFLVVVSGTGSGPTYPPVAIPQGEVHYLDQAGIFAGSNPAWSAGGVPSYGFEEGSFAPDFTALFDRVWVIGGQQKGVTATYTLSPTGGAPAGTTTFPMPAPLDNIRGATVTVGGVNVAYPDTSGPPVHQLGILGQDGSFGANGDTSGFKLPAVAGSVPPVIALKVPTTAGQVVTVSGQFRYPLIQVVTDPVLQAKLGGLIFEKVLRDKRITDQPMAVQYAQQNILAEGYSKKGGSVKTDRKGVGNVLVQPGQYITIQSARLFAGLLPGGATSGSFLITGVRMSLQEDTVNPYMVTISFADRTDSADADVFDHLIGEQGRVNAALEQTDVNQAVTDLQSLADILGLTELIAVGVAQASGTYHYGDAAALYDNATYA